MLKKAILKVKYHFKCVENTNICITPMLYDANIEYEFLLVFKRA